MSPLRGDPPVLVLVAVQDLVNLASCIRIAKNFGIQEVRLVNPECPIDFYRIEGVAHNTADLLARMTIHDSLAAATGDLSKLYALTGRERTAKRRSLRPRDGAAEIVAFSEEGKVGILAGREDHGLHNEELDQCAALVTISAEPSYSSLNLAQAWAIMAYEVWVARDGDRLPFKSPRRSAGATTLTELEHLFSDWQIALDGVEFFKKREPDKVMRGFRELIFRADPDAREVSLLRAAGLEIAHFLRRKGLMAPLVRRDGREAVGRREEG